MLTQQEVRQQLDHIADEVAQPAGVYYELYTRLYSERVRRWIRTVPHSEAVVIKRVVEDDPDYLEDMVADMEKLPPPKQQMSYNPAWDMDY